MIPGLIPDLSNGQVLKFMEAREVCDKEEADWTLEDRQTLLDMLAIRSEMHP